MEQNKSILLKLESWQYNWLDETKEQNTLTQHIRNLLVLGLQQQQNTKEAYIKYLETKAKKMIQ